MQKAAHIVPSASRSTCPAASRPLRTTWLSLPRASRATSTSVARRRVPGSQAHLDVVAAMDDSDETQADVHFTLLAVADKPGGRERELCSARLNLRDMELHATDATNVALAAVTTRAAERPAGRHAGDDPRQPRSRPRMPPHDDTPAPPPTAAPLPQVLDVLRHAKIAANHALALPRTRQPRLARLRNEVPPPRAAPTRRPRRSGSGRTRTTRWCGCHSNSRRGGGGCFF